MIRFVDWLLTVFARTPHSTIALLMRFAIGWTFWNAGQSKLAGYVVCLPRLDCFRANPFSLNQATLNLFDHEYVLPNIPGWAAAHSVALAEFALPILLFIGLGTRFAALGLLIITLVIQVFVFPGSYVTHALWAGILLALIKYGPGKFSLDHWLAQRY